jgi:Uma2 family endonuclease
MMEENTESSVSTDDDDDLPDVGEAVEPDLFKYLTGYEETPVDDEWQYLIPNLLQATLAIVWAKRWDWLFGIRLGIEYGSEKPILVPDAFLSLGVERACCIDDLRITYAVDIEEPVLKILIAVNLALRQNSIRN